MSLWADEEEPQWGVDEPETPAAPAEGAAAEGEKKEGEAAADGAPVDPAAAEAAAAAAAAEEEMRKYNRHWVRPKFLQYSYLYDYRKNYYDDVIDWMDRRSHGLQREVPRAQTWAERVLRTYNQKLGPTETATKVQIWEHKDRGWTDQLIASQLRRRFLSVT